jgi:hypothetical protein
MGIPDTSTRRRLSRVTTKQRPLMKQVPWGFLIPGKRSSPDMLAISVNTTLRAKKADSFGFPPLASQITKNTPEKSRIVNSMSGVLESAIKSCLRTNGEF